MYIDLVFLLNALADWAALWATGRLAGQVPRPRRLLPAAGLGGVYGVLCALPPLAALGGFFGQLLAALALVAAAFGRQRGYPRLALLFYMLSYAMGGALLAALRLLRDSGGLELLGTLNWKVFLLAGGGTYLALSLFLRGGARQAVEGRLLPLKISLGGRTARLAALLDTGHTLSDPVTGAPALTVWWEALTPLWSREERQALSRLETEGAAPALARLPQGRFRLLPYRAVGVEQGLMLCFTADGAVLGGEDLGRLTVALSPTALTETGGYAALWGGQTGKEARHAA